MTRIGIILGSTRAQRKGAHVARWVLDHACARDDAWYELIDLRDYPLAFFEAGEIPSSKAYVNESEWSSKIRSMDGFIIVSPEYNHSTTGVLKNAIDHLYAEWNNKAVGFVSYGGNGGSRATEHLRLIAGSLQMADVRQQVALSFRADFDDRGGLRPNAHVVDALDTLIDQVLAWTVALAPLRARPPEA